MPNPALVRTVRPRRSAAQLSRWTKSGDSVNGIPREHTSATLPNEVTSMIRLLYISQAAPGITKEQEQDILKSAQRNNPAAGLTGVLVRGGGLFMQILEGPEQAVLRRYVKILDDRRHGNCQIIHISPADDRIFDKWSMGAIDGNPLEFQHIAELRARRLEAVQAKAFINVMREFVQRLNAGM